MDNWDIVILVVAGYMAVISLVRLMIRRRDHMLAEFRKQVEAERQRKTAAEKAQQRHGRNAA